MEYDCVRGTTYRGTGKLVGSRREHQRSDVGFGRRTLDYALDSILEVGAAEARQGPAYTEGVGEQDVAYLGRFPALRRFGRRRSG